MKVSKGAKLRNRYNQVLHLTQDTIGKVTNSQLYTTNESLEASPFPAGDQGTNKQTHIKALDTREKKHKRSTKEVRPWNGQSNILLEALGLNQFHSANLALNSDYYNKVIFL